MAKLSRKDLINAKGLYNGWHGQQLQKRAINSGKTMAELFLKSIQNSCAFSVPAKLEILTNKWATYRFLDNSTVKLLPPNPIKKD